MEFNPTSVGSPRHVRRIARPQQQYWRPISTELKIRPLSPDDKHEWQALWRGYNAFYGRAGDTALPAEIVEMTWGRLFDPYEPMYARVAESGDGLLGLTHYLFHRNFLSVSPTCYLQDLFSSEEARGQGVGRALVEAVYDHARSEGISQVYWHTHESNKTAMALYDKVSERSGFLVYRTRL